MIIFSSPWHLSETAQNPEYVIHNSHLKLPLPAMKSFAGQHQGTTVKPRMNGIVFYYFKILKLFVLPYPYFSCVSVKTWFRPCINLWFQITVEAK